MVLFETANLDCGSFFHFQINRFLITSDHTTCPCVSTLKDSQRHIMECSNDSLGDLHNDQSNDILDAGVETSTVTGGDRGGDDGGISGDTLTVTSQLGSALSYAETVTMKEIQSSVFARGGFGEIRLGTSISGQLLALKSLYVRSKTQPDFRETKVPSMPS